MYVNHNSEWEWISINFKVLWRNVFHFSFDCLFYGSKSMQYVCVCVCLECDCYFHYWAVVLMATKATMETIRTQNGWIKWMRTRPSCHSPAYMRVCLLMWTIIAVFNVRKVLSHAFGIFFLSFRHMNVMPPICTISHVQQSARDFELSV